jgi:hypothetical protein
MVYSKMDQYYDFERVPRRSYYEEEYETRSQRSKIRPGSANK